MLQKFLAVFLCGCIVGCAEATSTSLPVSPSDAGVKFTEGNVNIVMARNVQKDRGATGITDTFTFEGEIFAVVTFNWDVEREGGKHNIQVKWYSGEKLIRIGDQDVTFRRPAHLVWFSTVGTNLGVGKAKVEIYADGVLVGTKHFAVVSQ